MPPPSRDIAAPWPVKPRQQIIQLRQLHLQLAFARAGAPGENIQDQLGAVDDLDVQRFFQIALLGGRQIVVEDHHGRIVEMDLRLELVDFAGADQRGRIRPRPGLDEALGHARAGLAASAASSSRDSSALISVDAERRFSPRLSSSPTR